MYATRHCSYCMAARMLFKRKGIEFDDILVSGNNELRSKMEQQSGQWTVPQIFIDGEPIGGFDELDALERDGTLDTLLRNS